MLPRSYCLPLIIGKVLLITYLYSYLYKKSSYTVFLDGKLVNFTGIEDFIPPFVNIVSDYFVAPKYQIMSCGIRKSMSQLTINIMCLLNNEQFLEGNHSLNDTWLTRKSCPNTPAFRKPTECLLRSNQTIRFAFIRDPFERFISFYLDKCLTENACWSCKSDMRCVVKNIYISLKKIQNHQDWKPIPTYMDAHAAPLSWNCDFGEDISKWIFLMMGADVKDRKASIIQLGSLLRRQSVSEDIVQRIQEEAIDGETPHSTHKSSLRVEAERRVREDPVVRDFLHKIYFFDYLVFPFSREHLSVKFQTDFWNVTE